MKLIYHPDRKSVSIEECKELEELSFCSSLPSEQLLQHSELIVSYVLKHPKALATVRKALEDGKILVCFNPHKEIASTASWNRILRHILIRQEEEDPHYILDLFIFEICNAINKRFDDIQPINCKDVEDYIRQIESAEWETYNSAAVLIQEGIQSAHLPTPKNGGLIRTAISFEKYLLTVSCVAASGAEIYHGFTHADIYRKHYWAAMIEIYNTQINLLKDKKDMQTEIAILQLKLKTASESLQKLEEKASIESRDMKKNIELDMLLSQKCQSIPILTAKLQELVLKVGQKIYHTQEDNVIKIQETRQKIQKMLSDLKNVDRKKILELAEAFEQQITQVINNLNAIDKTSPIQEFELGETKKLKP